MSNKLRLWIVIGLLVLVVLLYVLSYLTALGHAFDISEADLGLWRGRLEGIGGGLWIWLMDALDIEKRRRNPKVAAIADDQRD